MGNCAHKQNSGEEDESSLSSIEVKPSKQHYYHSKNHEDSSSLSSVEEGSMQSRIQERFVTCSIFSLSCPTVELIFINTDQEHKLSVSVISHFTFCVNCELCKWQFCLILMILSDKRASFAWVLGWFHVKSLKFQESGIDRISWFRTKVKLDSLKCKLLLSSMNFLYRVRQATLEFEIICYSFWFSKLACRTL